MTIEQKSGAVKPTPKNDTPEPATPLPWHCEPFPSDPDISWLIRWQGEGTCIAFVQDRVIGPSSKDAGQNAAYIVHAANNYPETKRRLDVCIEALKAIQELIDRDGMYSTRRIRSVAIEAMGGAE